MKNNLVVKSNELIESSYSLSLNEQRVLLTCISQIRSDEEMPEKAVFKVNANDLQDLFLKDNPQDAYYVLKLASKKLLDRKFSIIDKNVNKEFHFNLLQSIKLDNNSFELVIHFSDAVIPHLSNLKDSFTKYRLKSITQLTSVYAVRLYEMIVSWSKNGRYSTKNILIDDFKHQLKIADKYKQFGQFNDRVIKPALLQINEFTDFNLEIDFKKRGRSFHSLELKFSKKTEHQKMAEANNRKLSHLSKERQKQIEEIEAEKAEKERQRQIALFKKFCSERELTHEMKFEDINTQKVYEYINFNGFRGIMTNDYPQTNRYFLNDEHVLQLWFLGVFKLL